MLGDWKIAIRCLQKSSLTEEGRVVITAERGAQPRQPILLYRASSESDHGAGHLCSSLLKLLEVI